MDMGRPELDFDDLVQTLQNEENSRKLKIINDQWGVAAAPPGEARRVGRTRRMWPIWCGALLGLGTIGLIAVTGWGHHVLSSPARVDETYRTVHPESAGASAGATPLPEAATSAPSPAGSPELPAATAARRMEQRQRPIPAVAPGGAGSAATTPGSGPAARGQGSAAPDEVATPEALLELADHDKAAAQPVAAAPGTAPAPGPRSDAPSAEPSDDQSPAAAPASSPTLPEGLSHAAIQRGFAQVKARVVACRDRAPADATVAEVTVVIHSDGSLDDEITVDGALEGTDAAHCVAHAVAAARFAPFRGEPQTVTYPFPLR
jgi:hypothetical protein